MKKPYEKPAILFESFALSTNIAGDCEFIANFSQGKCGYKILFGTLERVVFVDSKTGCNVTVPPDVSQQDYIYNNQICYHVPIDSSNLFSS